MKFCGVAIQIKALSDKSFTWCYYFPKNLQKGILNFCKFIYIAYYILWMKGLEFIHKDADPKKYHTQLSITKSAINKEM